MYVQVHNKEICLHRSCLVMSPFLSPNVQERFLSVVQTPKVITIFMRYGS